jgi:hypothetical protein
MSVQALHTEESLSHIHSLPTCPATLATAQSAAVIAVRALALEQDEEMRFPTGSESFTRLTK